MSGRNKKNNKSDSYNGCSENCLLCNQNLKDSKKGRGKAGNGDSEGSPVRRQSNGRRREKRWPQCNFQKPCVDNRIYRDGEFMCTSFAGHVPGEKFIVGRNHPTCTTFAKRRLCQYVPYDFLSPDGCCNPNGVRI